MRIWLILLLWTIVPLFAATPGVSEEAYWLRVGQRVVLTCPGNGDGEPIKTANTNREVILTTGVVICRDRGSHFEYELSFLAVEINPDYRSILTVDELKFDWLGLAVYNGVDGNETVNWLYDEALPVRGQLDKTRRERIYFGALKFEVPKRHLAKASHFVFYLTARGYAWNFGLLR